MIELCYTSVACQPVTREGLRDLLRSARERNSALGVTGLLVYDDHRFIQILEGEAEAVYGIYERVKADPRHTEVELVYQGAIEQAAFAGWAMAFEYQPSGVERPSASSLLANSAGTDWNDDGSTAFAAPAPPSSPEMDEESETASAPDTCALAGATAA